MSEVLNLISQGFKADMSAGNPLAAALGAVLRALGGLLTGIYAVIPSYAIAIALLTLVVRAALWPLTAKQTKSMAAMQEIQPEVQELRKKHKDDRVKLNEELMALYQERKVNPLGGCLPILVQGPILFTLWRVLGVAWGAPRFKPFSGAVTEFCTNELGQPSQCVTGTAFLPPKSALFQALQHHEVRFFGVDLTRPGSGQQGVGVVMFIALVIAVAATMWYQQHQMQKRSGGVNPQMQAVTQVMPLLFGFLTYNLAGGLGIYFIVGNLFQIGQQGIMLKRGDAEKAARAAGDMAPTERPAKKGLLASLRERQQRLMAGESDLGKPEEREPAGPKGTGAAKDAKRGDAKRGDGRRDAGSNGDGRGGGPPGKKARVTRPSADTAPSRHRSKKKRKKKGR